MAILKGETAIDREVSRQEALKAIILFGERERKERLAESKVIQAETIRAEREINVEREEQIMFRKQKIRKLKRGLSTILMGFVQRRKKGKKSKKKAALRRRIAVVEIKIRMKKKSKIVGIFEKRQEEKSLFFKN